MTDAHPAVSPTSHDSGLTRRAVLQGAGAAGLGIVGLGAIGCGGDDAPSTAPGTARGATATPACVLTPDQTVGPYYIDLADIRRDVTEGRPGLPLELELKAVDSESCEPLAKAAIDIWQTDALGVYSAFEAEGTAGETFMRGTRLTDGEGLARFTTVYPGWYEGRVTHIHVMVHAGGTIEDGRYSGGEVAHTGQLYFSDDLTDRVYDLPPYDQRSGVRTRLSEDFLFAEGDGARMQVTELRRGALREGLRGRTTIGIARPA